MERNEIFLAVKVFHNEYGTSYKHKLIDYIKNGGNLEVRNKDGDTLFLHGIKHGGEWEYLATHGADVNARDANGDTALDYIARWDLVDALYIAENLVFVYGADLNIVKDSRLKRYLIKLGIDAVKAQRGAK